MAVSRKHRRAITVGRRDYAWYVAPDRDNLDCPTLTVISADRRFFIRFLLLQSEETRHVTVIGPEFRTARCGGCWRRFRCPAFGDGNAITPRDVRALIAWAHRDEPVPPEVDWRGQAIERTSEAV